MGINCVVVDAGARYGLHPSWAELRGLVDFHLFEMDADEAMRLQRKYENDPRITVYPVALYSSDTTLHYRVSEHHALNSVFETNDDLLRENEYLLRDFTALEEQAVAARTIDSHFSGREVHFLKLDIEGAEYEALRGAVGVLGTTVLGVRSEVLFAPIYKGAPLFGDLNRFLLDQGLELLNLDYTGAGNKNGRFTLPGRYGKLLSSDAVWSDQERQAFCRHRRTAGARRDPLRAVPDDEQCDRSRRRRDAACGDPRGRLLCCAPRRSAVSRAA